ncbi:MAG: acyltransferase [Clostridia bacterium]|nr:acyltransferase [Clostridia bacterium]
MARRKSELSFMNLVMCVLVIFIHIASWTINDMDRSSVKYLALMLPWRLSAFVVQGFLFLSGVKLFASKKPFSYPTFIKGRILKVYLPYLLWIGIYYAYFIGIGWYKFSFKSLAEYIALGTLCSHFYYVVIAMQFYLLIPLFKWLLERVNGFVLCILSVAITACVKAFVHFKYDDRVFFAYLCYFVIGALVGKNYEKFCAALKKYAAFVLGTAAVLGVFDGYFSYRIFVKGAYYKYFEVLHLFYCIAAISALFLIGHFLFEKRELPAILSLADRSTLYIYLSHILFIYIANDYLYRYGVNDMFTKFLLRGVFTYVCTFTGCLCYTFVKEKLYAKFRKN